MTIPGHGRAWGRAAPWVAGIGLFLFAAAMVIEQVGLFGVPEGTEDGPFFTTMIALAVLCWGGAGALIGGRRPENAIGLVLAGEAFLLGLISFFESYGRSALPARSVAADILSDWLLVPLLLAVSLLLLIFPTGRPPSRRWGWVGWGLAASALTGILGFIVRGRDSTATPFLAELLLSTSGILGLIGTVFAFVSVVIRFRRSRSEERAQLRWLVSIALLGAVVFVIAAVIEGAVGEGSIAAEILLGILIVILTVGFPASIGIAILRYRLYDLDLVIKKTVVFAIVAGAITLLALALLLAPVGLGGDLTGWERGLLVVGIAIGLLVGPLRRVAARIADRVVYGGRAKPYEVLAEFSRRVADAYSSEDILPRMAQIVAMGTGARSAHVWLRVANELRRVADWPDRDGAASLLMAGEELPVFRGGETAVEVRHQGELLGAISVVTTASDPMNPAKERLVRDLASQAGLVLRNVRLIEDVRSSRQRLVTAQDAERRRLERNIHDGAQQQLVALQVKLRLAEQLAVRDPEKVKDLLAELGSETGRAIDDLRDLARGIYPPLLADQGLVAAIEAQARRSPILVTVHPDGVGRYPQEIEAAVYFCTLEALNNIAKYAKASHVDLRLEQKGDVLAFEIRDDGIGFDPANAGHGTGLEGMADRVDAIGGALRIDAAEGTGTIVRGSVPAGGAR